MSEHNKNLTKEQGERLTRCRKYRNLTQNELGDLCGYTDKYISQLEHGKKPIDYNKAMLFAEKMEINPHFIMCKSDFIENNSRYDFDNYIDIDNCFLHFLRVYGFNIEFDIYNYLDSEKDRTTKRVPIDSLQGVSLGSTLTKYKDGDVTKDIMIKKVYVNDSELSYPAFSFTIKRIYDFIEFTFDSLKSFIFDYEYSKAIVTADTTSITLGGDESAKVEREKIIERNKLLLSKAGIDFDTFNKEIQKKFKNK